MLQSTGKFDPLEGIRIWSSFWEHSGPCSRCSDKAPPEFHQAIAAHWKSVAVELPAAAQVLDLGCGAGEVGRILLGFRPDLTVIGIDSARVPDAQVDGIRLISEVEAENLPFQNGRFDAVVSQFGFEYSGTAASAKEAARVCSAGARLSFIVHCAQSSVLRPQMVRLECVELISGSTVYDALMSGDLANFDAVMVPIISRSDRDELIISVARAMRDRLSQSIDSRLRAWSVIEDVLRSEATMLSLLEKAAVSSDEMSQWSLPLRSEIYLNCPSLLRWKGDEIIGWCVEGEIP